VIQAAVDDICADGHRLFVLLLLTLFTISTNIIYYFLLLKAFEFTCLVKFVYTSIFVLFFYIFLVSVLILGQFFLNILLLHFKTFYICLLINIFNSLCFLSLIFVFQISFTVTIFVKNKILYTNK